MKLIEYPSLFQSGSQQWDLIFFTVSSFWFLLPPPTLPHPTSPSNSSFDQLFPGPYVNWARLILPFILCRLSSRPISSSSFLSVSNDSSLVYLLNHLCLSFGSHQKLFSFNNSSKKSRRQPRGHALVLLCSQQMNLPLNSVCSYPVSTYLTSFMRETAIFFS